jgi:threonyl-tRNA synthetase
MPAVNDYAEEVRGLLRERGLYADADLSGNTLKKKIRSGQLDQYNFIFGKTLVSSLSHNYNVANLVPHLQWLGRRRKNPAVSMFAIAMMPRPTQREASSP